MATIANLTDYQIRSLQIVAAQRGNDRMFVICDIALDTLLATAALGPENDESPVPISAFGGDLADCYTTISLSSADWHELSYMSQDEARLAVVEAINEAEAMSSCMSRFVGGK